MISKTYSITSEDFPAPAKEALDMIHFDRRLREGIFFDIETTGFSPSKNALYLIGCCQYNDDGWTITQWLAQNPGNDEQRLILNEFLKVLQTASVLISYNGQTFDLPFLQKKCELLNIPVDLSQWTHWDLYRDIRHFHKLLGLDNLKLKTVERFLGITRNDMYSGKALIPIYESFAQNHNHGLKDVLLLHNYEDIKDMLFILPVLNYRQICTGDWTLAEPARMTGNGPGETSINLTADFNRPMPLPLVDFPFTLPCKEPSVTAALCIGRQSMTLTLPVLRGEMKYFYGNYKDYYYLPEEDYAIHKSVASFVDKAYRKKATPQNCYTKKTGIFLPQTEEIFSPVFKVQYNDKLTWFEYTDETFTEDTVRRYFQSFLCFLNLGSF